MAFGDIIQTKTGTGNAASLDVVLDSTPTEGNLLVVCHFTGDADSQAPTGFTEAVAVTDSPRSDQGAIYYKVAGSGESTTITLLCSSADETQGTIFEIEGPWESSPLDQSTTNGPTTGTAVSTGSTGTTSQNDEFAVCLVTYRRWPDTVTTGSWTNSFVERTDSVNTTWKGHSTATKLLTATGTVSTSCTLNYSKIWMAALATFKKQAAVGGNALPMADRHYRNLRT